MCMRPFEEKEITTLFPLVSFALYAVMKMCLLSTSHCLVIIFL